MLKDVDLSARLSKNEYKLELAGLEDELAGLQLVIKEMKIPVVIALEGFSAAGKGTLISKIVHPLDPRSFKVYTMGKVTENEIRRPFLWGYWVKMPADGEIVIFDKSWSRASLPGVSAGWKLNRTEQAEFYNDVEAFERQLYDSGTLVIKLFLHIGCKEQRRRLKELEKNPATAWRVNAKDFEQNDNYGECAAQFEKMLMNTNAGQRKWHVIEAEDKRYAAVKAYGIIIGEINKEIARRKSAAAPVSAYAEEIPSVLNTVDPQREIASAVYRKTLEQYQARISELGFKLYHKQRAVSIVYEGWDAAGKGGNIKRLTEELDPRGYEVVPIAAPSSDELAHHYLWRFYQRLPKDGHIAIFDRSWYGRVMVERIEGYARQEEWQRAYREINEMERHWTNHGMIILKFWMHIDQEEQLRRFNARLENPAKRYKITDEDWRNREKWDLYRRAVDEMLFRTDTSYAPWHVVPGNNKKFARLYVLERVIDELERRLKDKP